MLGDSEMLGNLDFEKRIKEMDDRSLLEFTARQTYDVCQLVSKHDRRLRVVENRDRKFMGTIGGIGGAIGAGIVAAINYFIGKN